MTNFLVQNAAGKVVMDDVTPMLVFRKKTSIGLTSYFVSGYPKYDPNTTYTITQNVWYTASGNPPTSPTDFYQAKGTTKGNLPSNTTYWTRFSSGDTDPPTYWITQYVCERPVSERPIIAVVPANPTHVVAMDVYSLDGITMRADIYINPGSPMENPATDPRTTTATIYEFSITTNADKTSSGFAGIETYDAAGNLLFTSLRPLANLTNAIWTGPVHYAPWSPTYTDTIYDGGKLLEAVTGYSASRTYAICNGIGKRAVWSTGVGTADHDTIMTAGCRITSGNVVAVPLEIYRSGLGDLGLYDRGWQPQPVIFDVTGL